MRDYLNERKIVTGEGSVLEQTMAVPQGSVIGTLLWNIFYDDVLSLGMPVDYQLVE